MDHLWLQRQFAAHPGKTRASLATALDLGAPAVSKILAGTRQIKAAEYATMRRFFGLPVDGERAAAGGVNMRNPLRQSLAESGANDPAEAWIGPATTFGERTKTLPDQVRIFVVQDMAMAPEFRSGEPLLVDLSDRTPSRAGIFVVSEGPGHAVRQVECLPHFEPSSVRLSARSSDFEARILPLGEAGIIGRVIARLQWIE